MKKNYEKPNAVVVEMSFDEHIAASGNIPDTGSCAFEFTGNIKTAGCSIIWVSYTDPTKAAFVTRP